MTSKAVAVSIQPTIASPKQPVRSGETEDGVKRPGPPNSPGHKKVCICTRYALAAGGEHADVVQQILLRDVQAAVGPGGLQVFDGEASPLDNLLPHAHPSVAKPTASIVEDLALAKGRYTRLSV